jgi:hypothetical protein
MLRESLLAGTPLSPKNLDEQAERDEEEIADVEMILETYFMHVDNTFNKLQTLCEYIDDTEVRAQGRGTVHARQHQRSCGIATDGMSGRILYCAPWQASVMHHISAVSLHPMQVHVGLDLSSASEPETT